MKKAVYISIIATLFSILISILFKAYLANNFDKTTLAHFYTSLDLVNFALMSMIGFRSAMVVSFAKTKDDIGIINLFRIALIFITILFSFIIAPLLSTFMKLEISTIWLVFLFVSFLPYTYFSNQLAMFRLYKAMNQTLILEPIFAIFGFFALYFWLKSYELLLVSTALGSLTLAIYLLFLVKKVRSEPAFSKVKLTQPLREFLNQALLSSLEFAVGMLPMYLAVVVLSRGYSYEILGDFQVVVKTIFMYTMMLFVFPIFKFSLPETALLVAEKESKKLKQLQIWVYKYAFFVTIGVLATFYFTGESSINLLFGKQYEKSYLPTLIMLFALFFAITNAYHLAVIKAHGRFGLSLFTRIFSVTVFILLLFLNEYLKGEFVGLVSSLAFGYATMYVISRYFCSKLALTI